MVRSPPPIFSRHLQAQPHLRDRRHRQAGRLHQTRLREEAGRVTRVDRPAAGERQQGAGVFGDQPHVVRDHHDRPAARLELAHHLHQPGGLDRVLAQGGLVEDERRAAPDEHGRHAQPALLSLAERERVRLGQAQQAQAFQPIVHRPRLLDGQMPGTAASARERD